VDLNTVACGNDQLPKPPLGVNELASVARCDWFAEEPAATAANWVLERTIFLIAEGGWDEQAPEIRHRAIRSSDYEGQG
jgi:hypothetical protein